MNIFNKLQQGDSRNWVDPAITLSDKLYTATDWTLKYYLRGPSAPVQLTGVANGSGWAISIAAADSGNMQPGKWWWTACISNGTDRYTVGEGSFVVTPDFTAATGTYDGRTVAEKALADAEAALANFKNSKGLIKQYSIGSRSMEFSDSSQILEVISYWKRQVRDEKAAASIANGQGNPNRLLVRFKK